MRLANRSTLWLAASLLCISACDSCGSPAARDTGTTPEDPHLIVDVFQPTQPSEFFPMHVGDRWAYRHGDALQIRGITALDDRGDAYLFGDGLSRAGRFRLTAAGIMRVLEGKVLPWLQGPAEAGREWTYVSGDAACMANYTADVQTLQVAGLSLENCVRVERSCRLPAGKPFATATLERHEEVYCPSVGLVHQRLSFDPPPAIEGVEAVQEDELVNFQVAGAPLPRVHEPFDCESLLLLESDVQTACGPNLRRAPQPPSTRRAQCERVFESPEGSLRVRVQQLEMAATDEDLERALARTEGRFGEKEGRFLILLDPSAACPRERASRLLPLLHSLVAPATAEP
ncbi:MAG: hypothetical protein GXP55_13590 [Deltaproteobacteria bacterium]|nr:hypothetical protein [Deltaproteobacteria bacterium]